MQRLHDHTKHECRIYQISAEKTLRQTAIITETTANKWQQTEQQQNSEEV